MKHIYKTATKNQKEEIFKLYTLVMRDMIEKVWGWNLEWQKKDFSTHFVEKDITLAYANEKIVGYLHCENKGHYQFVRMLLLHPDYQGKGIGSKLLSRLIKEARDNAQAIKLEVFKVNSEAMKFYEKFGFKVTGKAADSFIMEKNA